MKNKEYNMIDGKKSNSQTGDLISAYVVTSGNRVETTEYNIIEEEEESDPETEDLRTKMVLSADVVSATRCAALDAEEANSQAILAYASALNKKKSDKNMKQIRQIILGE